MLEILYILYHSVLHMYILDVIIYIYNQSGLVIILHHARLSSSKTHLEVVMFQIFDQHFIRTKTTTESIRPMSNIKGKELIVQTEQHQFRCRQVSQLTHVFCV